ncbi:MAG: hypothetical protein CO094_00130 [Anaerolineae bacterium CG_4_9_14_3_um_filter_57_17]|nr:Asp23/Gls24 family envelope stress response protein [bacterium]NCT21303.1 Asp23/Gls24 family envelope stress response protein [bacterium]OIO84841.1 MAG: hypothetical protein AUK01_08495 [Anaerolineae bacterium CG2_30_57_67]PJB68778.1 MAG: hypothetical protein CO094_00130 [Anaerolineae bacterium CG_4_9_14_3_um_filter_57_17]
MSETYQPTGKTTLSPDVLLTIAKMAALSVEGVARLAPVPGGFGRFFRRGANEGVQIKVEDGLVYLDLFVILQKDVNVRDASRNIQQQVARAIEEMVGMDIGHVNIHVEDIDYV